MLTIIKKKLNFSYRKIDLPDDFIITTVIFKINHGSKLKIKDKIEYFKKQKETAQPSKIKTGGSTFKKSRFKN